MKMKEEENLVDEIVNQCLTGTRKLERNTVQEQPTFEIDLRIEEYLKMRSSKAKKR